VYKNLVKIIFIFFFLTGVSTPSALAQEKTGQPVDVVFCLDLSSSSNGLIDQFRNHLWDYWYFFSRCNPQPNYRIGVVAYARFSYGKSGGYTKVINDLGNDFEKMSNILFKITSRIEKGDQYVGSALSTCLKKISWSKNPETKKIIFLVGNGDVTTGPDDIDEVVDKLAAQKIIVHSVYCTAPGERKAIKGWELIAQKTSGKISTISIRNHYFDRLNGFDIKRFRTLNRRFNQTYLYYGKNGKADYRLLQLEDNHIYVTNTEGFRFRALYKTSDDFQRKNAAWDLVDLYYKNPVGFINVDKKLLNDTCRKMTNSQLRSYIIYKKYERKKLSSMIQEMIAEKERKDIKDGIQKIRTMPTLDKVGLEYLREILKESGCECLIN
jgi:hypothetical protein